MFILELQSVSKVFRRHNGLLAWNSSGTTSSLRAVDNISFTMPAGAVHVLVGPNGSGKTTLLKLISTILLPDSGRILVAGADAVRELNRVRRHVGFAIANERSFSQRLTVRENLEFFATFENVPRSERRERVHWAMGQTGVEEFEHTLAYQLSGGMYQRVGVARALLKRPSLLLLDEPTRSIDPGGAARFWRMVRNMADDGTAVLLATHSFEEALAVAHVIAVLRHGTLVAQQTVTGATTVESLRSFYFGELEEEPAYEGSR